MLILFDHVTPKGVARFLPGHTGTKAKDRGWDTLTNGELLAVAEQAGFDMLVTADKNMRYQQNLEGRRIALVVLSTPQWPVVKLHLEKIAAAVNAATPGSYAEVDLSLG
jgi:predicted nuclease of predicted toxin-antitoxin system